MFKDDLNERERERERGGENNEIEKKKGSRRQSKKEGDNGSRGVETMFRLVWREVRCIRMRTGT